MLKTINLDDLRRQLFNMKDIAYCDFHSRLVPNLDKKSIIGVRTPELRKLTKQLASDFDVSDFLTDLPHKYYEENNIHAFLIQNIKNFDECISKLSDFLPYIDNWATCDALRPLCFKKNESELYKYIEKWIKSDHTYTVRFAIGMLNSYYLDEHFDISHLNLVASVCSSEYYINMMRAWYFASALSFKYDETIVFIENKKLDKWTHNKAIQKAVESLRISRETKDYIKKLKIK